MSKNTDLMLANCYYHIYNRAIGSEPLFFQPENYPYFLTKLIKYVLPVADIFSHCLLPNHFHLFIRIRNTTAILDHYKVLKGRSGDHLDTIQLNNFIVSQFGNACNAYSKSVNKAYQRKGRLFIDPLKRKAVLSDKYFSQLIFYIHANPVHHGYIKAMDQWPYSSYRIFTDPAGFRERDPAGFGNPPGLHQGGKLPGHSIISLAVYNEVLHWFGGRKGFIDFHQRDIHIKSAFD